jgi:phosphate uptake regulator
MPSPSSDSFVDYLPAKITAEFFSSIGYMINLLLVSRHLERIADLTTNIAEEVIYLVEGEISRHRMSKPFPIS